MKQFVCRECKGIGEITIEPGGDGYAPIYGECPLCEGTGMEEEQPQLEGVY